MKKALIVLGGLTCFSLARGQTVTPTVYANDGGFSAQAQGQIQWTIGEPVSETYVGPSNVTTMGFNQPDLGIISLIQEQGNNVSVLLFPNPVVNELRIDFSSLENGKYNLDLYDAIGKLIRKDQKQVDGFNEKLTMPLQELAAGEYFLTVSNGSSFSKTFKIIKVNN
jgi:hypothetical protein